MCVLRTKHRKCHLLPHCLSLSTETMNVKYRQNFNVGKVMSEGEAASLYVTAIRSCGDQSEVTSKRYILTNALT